MSDYLWCCFCAFIINFVVSAYLTYVNMTYIIPRVCKKAIDDHAAAERAKLEKELRETIKTAWSSDRWVEAWNGRWEKP